MTIHSNNNEKLNVYFKNTVLSQIEFTYMILL